MIEEVIATKLYRPHIKQKIIKRKRLIKKLDHGFEGSVILVSAPAGFGKTTVISGWIEDCRQTAAWLSIDKADNDPAVFLIYLVSALRTIDRRIGDTLLPTLQASDSPDVRNVLARIINDLSAVEDDVLLVIDDYHLITSAKIHDILMFLIDHMPPNMYLVISTREDPPLNLVRLRGAGQLLELRAKDLRFTLPEIEEFFCTIMNTNITKKQLEAIEQQSEGWITGLKLSAISMKERNDQESLNDSFQASNPYIMDYLVQEVLKRQPEDIQNFLLGISVLDRFCAPLCDAVLRPLSVASQRTLEQIQQKNLFVIPVDDQGKWYRYHHLFKDALYKKLQKLYADSEPGIEEFHKRASVWLEDNQLYTEALNHAAMAKDYDSVVKLISDSKIHIHKKTVMSNVLNILNSLPRTVFSIYPILQIELATMTLATGKTDGVEENLDETEDILQRSPATKTNLDLQGRIAAARSTLAFTSYQFNEIIKQSELALELLDKKSQSQRATAFWTKANALELSGRVEEAAAFYDKAYGLSRKIGNTFLLGLSLIGRARICEYKNDLHGAEKLFSEVINLFKNHLIPVVGEAYMGLARVLYQWNRLEAAYEKVNKSLELTMLYEEKMDRYIVSEVLMATVLLAMNETDNAVEMLEKTALVVRQKNFSIRFSEVAAARTLAYLRQGRIEEAESAADSSEFPLPSVKVLIAKGDSKKALILLDAYKKEMLKKGFEFELLKINILEAEALSINGNNEQSLQSLSEALTVAEPGGFLRVFIDEGDVIKKLLIKLRTRRFKPGYIDSILDSFNEDVKRPKALASTTSEVLVEPLTPRELEILNLIAEGLSNHQIASSLNLALDTVKGHNRNIFSKLQAGRRTEAVARARDLGLF